MLLSKEKIRKAVDAGDIGIDPIPDDDRIQPSSVDLRLGSALLVYPMEPVRGVTLDPRSCGLWTMPAATATGWI